MILLDKLREQGWHLTEEGLKKLTIINNIQTEVDIKKIISLSLNWDLKDIAAGALPSKLDSNGTIPGNLVLQIQKMRNISAPKANEESTAAPRFLQLELSDGVNSITALEFEFITALNLNVPPGTKIFLKSARLKMINGFMILKASDVEILGGKVETLVEKWELARQMLKYARNNRRLSGSSGPPPWVAFGKRLDAHKDALPTDTNFKSLQIANEKDKNSKENNEFNASRSQAIAEAAKAGQKKVFGGGQQNILDHNVKKILEKGYSEEDAKQALKSNNNNLERALYNLKRKTNTRIGFSENIEKSSIATAGRVRDKSAVALSKEEAVAAKPQTNISLLDFLTDKLPTSISTLHIEKTETNKERNAKDDTSAKAQNAKVSNAGGNKFENNMSSSFAANRATTSTTRSEEKLTIQSRPNNFNRKQDEIYHQSGNKPGKFGERNNSNRIKNQTPNNSKVQNKIPPPHENNMNVTENSHTKRNERSFKKEKEPRQSISEYQAKKRPNDNNKITDKKSYQTKDVYRNNQDSKSNNNNYQQKQKSNNLEKDFDNLINRTSKLAIQNKKDISYTNDNMGRNQQYSSANNFNQQAPTQMQKSQYYHNNSLQKSSKKSFQQNMNVSDYGPQVGNGFAYDPSKIVGFQSKETNEYAMNMLKSQGMTLQQIQQQQIASPQAPQGAPLPLPPSQQQLPQNPVLNNQSPATITYMTPTTNIFITQSQKAQFGMISGENWPWNEGDLCLAKYWDDGNFYNAKITGVGDKTCVVLFLGYGNHEEVLKSDCVPITDAQHLSLNPYQANITASPIQQQTPSIQQRSNMSGGISGVGNQRYKSERKMYVPPPKRTNN